MNNPYLVSALLLLYFSALLLIAWYTSKGATTDAFFNGNRQSPWYLVAFGMIGASLSGVTFISVPGAVGNLIPGKEGLAAFGYFQVVLGYALGYLVIGTVLMPMYYRLNLVSIYTYLDQRFGFWTYKTGAAFFILSRSIGSSLRLFLAAVVLQKFLFDGLGVHFYITTAITIVLIWVYTFRGGIKTIIWTDTFQTFFLVTAVIIAVVMITQKMNWGFGEMISAVNDSPYSDILYFEDWKATGYFWKQFLGGAFLAIAMTGLDQDLMQKNLTCRSIGDAQKNMFWFTIVLVIVNLLFLTLGALLYLYANKNGIKIPDLKDGLFPMMAFKHLGLITGIFFLLGIIASSYASADSALAALTTSFCIDFLNFKSKPESQKKTQKFYTHVAFSLLFFLLIIIYKEFTKGSVIDAVLTYGGYTYGPLIGLYALGLFTRRRLPDAWVPFICIASPLLTYLLAYNASSWFNGYKVGNEVILINGIVSFLLLYVGSWFSPPPKLA